MSSAETPQMAAASSGEVRLAASASAKPLVEASTKAWSSQPLVGDVGEHRVEEREVGAGVDGEVQHVVGAGRGLAGVDRHSPARIGDDDPGGGMRLARQLFLLLGYRLAGQVRDPVVEEVVGLGLERVGADRHDGVGEFGVLVAVVELAHPHVAGGVDLRVVGRAVVDADVLDLHRFE
jgi:hypothetical protein